MVITWFGLSCFKISAGPLTLVTDPFAKTVGLTPPRVQTDLAVISNIKNPFYNNVASLGGENLFLVDGPGEYDVKGLFVHGIAADGGAIYAIRLEDIRLGFLGSIKQKELTDSQLESLGEIDILLVPVGGKTVCDAEEAVTLLNQIEPRIVIPMHYAQSGLRLPAEKVEHFLKEVGQADAAAQDKLTIKKSNLAEAAQGTRTVVLAPQR